MMKKLKGFTLLEMLLVLVIAASILAMLLTYTTQKSDQVRQDRTTAQMQQILNAALSFYNQKGRWPGSVSNPPPASNSDTWTFVDTTSELISGNYIPPGRSSAQGMTSGWANPYGVPYWTGINTSNNNFYVTTGVNSATASSAATMKVIAGLLPFGQAVQGTNTRPPASTTACSVGGTCNIVASVPPPGQNLNNARSLNFGGMYHNGACVPQPTCPTGMTGEIIVAASDVKGVYDQPTCTGSTPDTCTSPTVYPLTSYTAFATGSYPGNSQPAACSTGGDTNCYSTCSSPGGKCSTSGSVVTGQFWRVCLQIVTSKGTVAPTTNIWGQLSGSVLVVTRCVPTNEPSGSDFTVWTN